ncbi:MAG: DUF1800 domain-containing protein [Chromatiales bacterium]|nr:MAG: DUF1800 domain-containing protein [Chromatiales bacterium]
MKDAAKLIPPLDRRRFLEMAGRGIGASALVALLPGCGSGGGGSSGGGLGGTGVPLASLEVQALRRTSFGVSPDSLAAINALGVPNYLEQQLNYQAIDDSAIEAAVASTFPLASQTPAQLYPGFPDNIGDIVEDLVGATLYRAFFSPRQLYEVMVEFWSNHFSIHLVNGIIPALKPYDDFAVIRPNAMGKFRDLLQASAKSPAMLYYLDNFVNFVGEPQENYARELLELHTLGVDGGYTEDDVKEVARCFTGWTINQNTGEFLFVPFLHDNGAKTVLGTLIPVGGGVTDGETVLDLLASHPSTANFIATKLCRRFLSDDPPAGVIAAVATTFNLTDGDVVEMLRTLFASGEFQDIQDQKLARPMEFIGGLVRALNVNQTLPPDDGRLYFALLNLLSQVPFYWIPPNGYPDVAPYWGSTSGFLNRWRIALALNAPVIQEYFPVEHTVAGATNLAETVDLAAAAVLYRELSVADRTTIIDWLVTELGVTAQQPLDQATVNALAPFVVAMLVSSVYFQLR